MLGARKARPAISLTTSESAGLTISASRGFTESPKVE